MTSLNSIFIDPLRDLWYDMTSFVDRLLGNDDDCGTFYVSRGSGQLIEKLNEKQMNFLADLPYNEFLRYRDLEDYLVNIKQLCRMGAELQQQYDDEFEQVDESLDNIKNGKFNDYQIDMYIERNRAIYDHLK